MPPRNSNLGVLPLSRTLPVKSLPSARAGPPSPASRCLRAIDPPHEQAVCSTLFVVLNLASVAIFVYSVVGR